MRVFLTALLSLIIIGELTAQSGGLAGAVTDAITGRELVGVTVTIKPGGTEDVTDVEGRFLFSNVQPGIYSIELRELNHKTAYILDRSFNPSKRLLSTLEDRARQTGGPVVGSEKPSLVSFSLGDDVQ